MSDIAVNASASAPAPACLLCDSIRVVIEDELTGRGIMALWRTIGRTFSPDALAPVLESTRIQLFRCGDCGFRFYDTRLAGSGRFYEELMMGGYYAATRPEFEFSLGFLRAQNAGSVLDVGGGSGDFLDLARQRGLKTFGVELNAAAAARAAAKGHRMIGKPLADVTPDEVGGGVDMVTLHQVAEHVPDPVAFVGDAARLARPGGFVMVAVPNEHRICGLVPLDPANWPPHHVSRWRKQDLRRLMARAGLSVVGEGSDILVGKAFEDFLPMQNRLARAIGRKPYPLDERGARVLSFVYRKLGLKHFFPRLGLSLYIIAQKPPRSG